MGERRSGIPGRRLLLIPLFGKRGGVRDAGMGGTSQETRTSRRLAPAGVMFDRIDKVFQDEQDKTCGEAEKPVNPVKSC